MPSLKNDNNSNINSPLQQHHNPEKGRPKEQMQQQNIKDKKVNAFDYNNPPNSHSLDDNQQDKPEENQGKPKSRWVDYLLFFAGLLMIGGGIALAVLINPWCGFVCLGGLITSAVGVIRWNGKEQEQYLPTHNNKENEQGVDEKVKENGKGNELEKAKQVNQGMEEPPIDFASMLKNMEDEVKNEEAKNANNSQNDVKDEPNEIVETAKEKPEKKPDKSAEKVEEEQPEESKKETPQINDKKDTKPKEKANTKTKKEDAKKMVDIQDFAKPSKITGKNNTESKNNLKTNNQAKDKSNGLSTN